MDVPDAIQLMGDKQWQEIKSRLTGKFNKMMKGLFRQKGAQLDINILASDEAQDFITTHAGILDGGFQKVEMSDKMRERLTRSNYIFSGIKTFHELNEAFPSMLDENGNKKTFERFLNDVQKINSTYNANYLHAEHNFVQASATMAAKWEQFSEDGDRYYLQYRTAKDDKVRPEHAALDGVTLPMSDSFWETYYPPNGWNCRCTAVQVRKQKYPATEHAEAMSRGEEAMNGERYNIFRFNSGKQGKTMPDYNPYTIRRCNDCDVAKGKLKLSFVPENNLCASCIKTRECWARKHGKTEKKENVRVATYLAEKHEHEIDLIANPQNETSADSFNRTLGIEQEYKVNNTPTKSSIDNLIRKGAKQADDIVLFVDSEISLNDLSSALHDRVRRTNLKTVMIVIDEKDKTYTYDEITAKGFKIRQADLK